jgi:asparagine synthase (glutamine-hydrolysing)
MCGVVGFIGGTTCRDERITAIRRGLRSIVHRGPEEVGYYHDPYFTLGTVRLSVVDLALGKQPMMSANSRFLVGFNGEIFNFLELRAELESSGVTFYTRSDTEVLLQCLATWGVDQALQRLNGQFGFAFYDRRERKLVLGRDPLGERPMYYSVMNGVCYFASEVKGIFSFAQIPRELDAGRVLAAARFWAPIPDETCFSGIECLPQGHYLTAQNGDIRLTKYYHGLDSVPECPADERLTFEEGAEQLRQTFRDSVSLRLRGDYPLGVFVSGGVDSAIVAATMSELLEHPVRAFSIRVDSPAIDETVHQQKVVASLGMEHSAVVVRSSDIRERFPKLIEQCEVPLHRTAPVACGMLAEHVGAAGVRIVLGGEGADELFLGYDIVKEASVVDQWLSSHRFDEASRQLDAALDDLRYTSSMTGREIMSFYRDRPGAGSLLFGPHLRRFRAEGLEKLVAGRDGPAEADARLCSWILSQVPDFGRWDVLERTQWLDIHTLFIGYGMTCHGDRPGTGCGVETRFPFLDRAVVRLASRMPRHWKLPSLSRGKHILREAYRPALPADVIDRPKFGMRTPGARALLRNDTDDWVRALLSPENVRASTVLRPDAVLDFVGKVESQGGEINYPDTHAYLHLLSILLMEEIFTRGFSVPDADIDRILRKRIDGEELDQQLR